MSKLDKTQIKAEEKKKRMIMMIGVPVIMIIIFVLWIFNLDNSFSSASLRGKEKLNFDFGNPVEDIKEDVSDIGSSLEDLIQVPVEEENIPRIEDGTEIIPINDSEEVPVEEVLVGDVPVKEVISNCPEYINCMPGPELRDCTIPPGCEDITIIAY